jgi:hypothetical protein
MNRSYSKIRHIQEANHRLEKRLVENVITEEEEEIDEANPITGLVKGLVQGGKNLVNKAMGTAAKKAPQYFDELPVSAVDDLMKAGVPRSTATLLGKLGTVKMSDFLIRSLKSSRDEIFAAKKDILNLMSTLKPDSAAYEKFNIISSDLENSIFPMIETMKGQNINLAQLYKNLWKLRQSLSGINLTVPMSPKSKQLLMILNNNVGEAIQKFDDAISDIITK